METSKAQELLNKYTAAMAYVDVHDSEGNRGIGTAFHVGDGVFVTARHVVEGKTIVEVKPTEAIRVPISEEIPEYTAEHIEVVTKALGQEPTWPTFPTPLKIISGPFFHIDEKVDVAVFKVESVHPKMPYVPLGSHLDDWITPHQWRLSEAIVLGYPPIPFTSGPELFAARAEINAVLWTRAQPNATFILSAMPRGGFSGGLALHEWGFALGLVTQSLMNSDQPAELGYLSVLTIEPIFECLAQHKLLPECQKNNWNDFWNKKTTHITDSTGLVVASVDTYDDGKRFYIGLHAENKAAFEAGTKTLKRAIGTNPYEIENIREGFDHYHLNISPDIASTLLPNTAIEIVRTFLEFGTGKWKVIRSDVPQASDPKLMIESNARD